LISLVWDESGATKQLGMHFEEQDFNTCLAMGREKKMERFRNTFYGLNPYLLSSFASVLTVAQIALAFIFYASGYEAFKWVGWICVWASAIFGVLPIITFRRRGGVAKGESYTKTTLLVDTGIYAIVRHPQGGTAWLMINFGIILITLHWSSLTLGLLSMALVYADTYKADQYLIVKFGDSYRRYIKRVPRVNFIAGIIRRMRQHGTRALD
jgi:protein-S-isoprenylcysteine O-methyltransferase Ste14